MPAARFVAAATLALVLTPLAASAPPVRPSPGLARSPVPSATQFLAPGRASFLPPAGAQSLPPGAIASLPFGPALAEKGELAVDGRLLRLAEIRRAEGIAAAAVYARLQRITIDGLGRVRVLVHANTQREFGRPARPEIAAAAEAIFAVQSELIGARVRALGGELRGRIGNRTEADLFPDGAAALAAGPLVAWIEASPRPVALQGQVVSQGVSVVGADRLQGSPVGYQPAAAPVRIGVLDTGFFGFEELLGSELPSSVTALSFDAAGIGGVGQDRHGTAVAEIVHDMAPEAQLFFTNIDSGVSHAQAVSWLISQNVDVISNSVAWFNAGPGDGRGPINDDVRRALNAGIEWVVAAGNQAQRHWSGRYADPNGNTFHNFSAADETNAVFLEAGESMLVSLSWDDWFASDQDYDLLVFDPSLALIAASVNPQTGPQPPAEIVGFTAPSAGIYHVAIQRFSATRDVDFRMFLIDGGSIFQHIVSPGSLTVPADTVGAIAVGATRADTDTLEAFSSWGPTTDGRTKPDLTAPDRVGTVSFGPLGFAGTSAATPHVSGAIALMKSRFGIFSLEQVVQILKARALPKGDANQFGAGRLDLIGQ